jgi:hypothetical protein
MAKKKNFLEDFEFKKLENLSNGLEIPISNPLKQRQKPVEAKNQYQEPVRQQPLEKAVKSDKKGHTVELPDLNYKDKGVKPMVNVVPTSITSEKERVIHQRQPITDLGFDKEEFGALRTKEEKVTYLAMRGWSLKVESRRNALYHYATKYINRKKKRLYLGSINS